ncbi:hypothetical protein [Mycobacteroides abscessus]|uniref:hypothetical protein n=1 Tax=Mycobacteroides abscessus TaxID=36809 RepID=UPI001041FF70|nr:hypothetical protein [Mycobacteroides abscessus]
MLALIGARRRSGATGLASVSPAAADSAKRVAKISSLADADPSEVRVLHQAAADYEDVRRQFLRRTAFRVAGFIFVVLCVVLITSFLASIIHLWTVHTDQHAAPESLWEGTLRARAFMTGRVRPSTSLAVVTAVLATVVAINIAISADNSRAGRRDTIEYGVWRRYYSGASLVSAVVAGLFGWVQWFSIENREDGGIAAGATLLALATLWLAWVSVGRATEFDHGRNFKDAMDRIQALANWRSALVEQYRVPIGRGHLLEHRTKRVASIIGVLTGAVACYVIATLGVMVAIYGFKSSVNWDRVTVGALLLVALNVGLSIAVLYVCHMATVRVWSHPTAHPKWKLTWQPIVIRSVYLPWAFLFLWAVAIDVNHTDMWRALSIVALLAPPFLLTPAGTWVVLRLSRLTRPPKWSSWLAAPVWDAVSSSLNSQEDSALRRGLNAYNDHVESLTEKHLPFHHNPVALGIGEPLSE